MTAKNYTHIEFVIDRSGSMEPVARETIAGFNKLLDDQTKAPGHCTVGAIQFDHEYERLFEMKPAALAPRLTSATYQPRGYTALLDAICKTVDDLGRRLDGMKEKDRPEKVIFVIQTDGLENMSKEFKRNDVRARIERQRKDYQWEFVFLGASEEAFADATLNWGIPANSAAVYTSSAAGTENVYASVSNAVLGVRSGSRTMNWTPAEIQSFNDVK